MRIGLIGVGRIGAFHAATLKQLPGVDEVVVGDAVPQSAQRVAEDVGAEFAADVPTLLAGRLDGLVIATVTASHAQLLKLGIAAGVPTFCEKPVAATLAETIEVCRLVASAGVPVQVGFQRRFDRGYQRVRHAIRTGELGFVHTIRANTHDPTPPPAAYIATSGGIFRDCSIHDFDIVRFLTEAQTSTVYAAGANRGESFFIESGDVDTAAAVLTLDDGTVVLVSATRYNGAGYDVRLEAMGSTGAMSAGLDDHLAMTSAEEGVNFPAGPAHQSFMDRFRHAYRAELTAFVEVVKGERASPCTVLDALEAFRVAEACEVSRRQGRLVRLEEVDGL